MKLANVDSMMNDIDLIVGWAGGEVVANDSGQW